MHDYRPRNPTYTLTLDCSAVSLYFGVNLMGNLILSGFAHLIETSESSGRFDRKFMKKVLAGFLGKDTLSMRHYFTEREYTADLDQFKLKLRKFDWTLHQ